METSAVELRPRGIGQLFDLAIRIYRKNFFKYVGIVAVSLVPVQIMQLVMSFLTYGSTLNSLSGASYDYARFWSRFFPAFIGILIISIVAVLLVTGISTAALTRAVADSYLGEKIDFLNAFRKIGGVWKPVMAALILIGLLNIPLLIWLIIPCVGWFTGPGILIYLDMILIPLVTPVIVIEGRGASQSIRRAWELARSRFWWVAGFFTLLLLFNLLVVNGPVSLFSSLLQNQLMRSFTNPQVSTAISMAVSGLAGLLLSLLYFPLQSACAVMAYFDLRIRMEALDLALMTSLSNEAPLNATEIVSQPSALPATALVTMKEIGFFALISLGGLALYFIPVFLLVFIIGMTRTGF